MDSRLARLLTTCYLTKGLSSLLVKSMLELSVHLTGSQVNVSSQRARSECVVRDQSVSCPAVLQHYSQTSRAVCFVLVVLFSLRRILGAAVFEFS